MFEHFPTKCGHSDALLWNDPLGVSRSATLSHRASGTTTRAATEAHPSGGPFKAVPSSNPLREHKKAARCTVLLTAALNGHVRMTALGWKVL
ncbi:MAG: hypothetical protein ISR44_04175 [Rhodospirillales bacterium]|nr:hypothetical protein [Rhodospirillales bacterium]